MLFNIDNILERKGIDLKDTVYVKEESCVRQFMMSAGDFFEVCRDRTDYKVYEDLFKPEQTGVDSIPKEKLEEYKHRLSEIKRRLKELKTDEEDLTHAHSDEIKLLRQEKQQLNTMLGNNQGQQNQKLLIKFKNCLIASSFQTVKRCIPQLEGVNFRNVNQMPLFVKNLPGLAEACRSGKEVAVTGGPCLFGVHEVLVKVYYQGGYIETYDFSSGRNFMHSNDHDLAEDLEQYCDQVEGIEFVNQKKSATIQEYDSIHCLFEYAKALKSKLTIPLPDMSYIKFLKNIVSPLRKDIAEDAVEKFRLEAYKISDMYLAVIDEMKAKYPEVEYAVIHERDDKMMQLYYENRKPFCTSSVVKKLTAVRGKTEAVLDYITMPALPYYIWGVENIIQMDCLDETDSYRKCIKMHKGKLNIYAMLYPEKISGDGENTVFYAPMEYKEYLADQPKRKGMSL